MQAAPAHRPLLALLIRLGAIAALSTMSALIKLASERGVHLAEIMFWRQFTSLPILLAWVLLTAGSLSPLRTRRPGSHVLRGLYGTVGMILNFGAVILLPLAEATVLNFTAPIWATILAMLLLKEHVGIWRWSAIVLGFVGVIVIAQPGGGHIPLFGALVGLGAAFMIGLISIQVADLGRTDKPLTIVFYFACVTTALTAPALPFVASAHDAAGWWLLLGIGISGTIGQLLLTAALRFGKVASVTAMDYSSLVWATLYGALLFGVFPSVSTWFGAPLVVAAGLVIAWREHRLSKARAKPGEALGGT